MTPKKEPTSSRPRDDSPRLFADDPELIQKECARLLSIDQSERKEALSAITSYYLEPLEAFLMKLTRDRDWMEELRQEALTRAYTYYRPGMAFGRYLGAIALNAFRSTARRKIVVVPIETYQEFADEELRADERMIAIEGEKQRDSLADLLLLLPVDAFQILSLYYYEDKSFAEIAHILGISAAVARRRTKKALQQLRELLNQWSS